MVMVEKKPPAISPGFATIEMSESKGVSVDASNSKVLFSLT